MMPLMAGTLLPRGRAWFDYPMLGEAMDGGERDDFVVKECWRNGSWGKLRCGTMVLAAVVA